MISKEIMQILSVSEIASETVEMVLRNEYISEQAIPGQFLHILIDGHTLRRPISIADINRESKTVTILFKIIGDGTKTLAGFKEGMEIDVLGPSGNGFLIEEQDSVVLLIGGGIGVPPMYYLARTMVKKGKKVIAVLGFQSKSHVFYEEKFKELGETIVVTNDGSYGERGFVTDILGKIGSFDTYYSCGPVPMLRAVTNELQGRRGFISIEERMGCGVGACLACVIPATDEKGYKKICSDGPVFDAREVTL
ncbi:dihydroorotate dehydrogenase electron transfer subunit [Oceanobacillus piezotolerans]|uniref:Dihydroorotate dehydrogenase B (NAD(+)), electron transfer subunit n=1 Tax=Oceanobacillus piezotolerans TaxID=2448030 RepID=A0A498DP67_9BACI|nr:dihydroorotate dehydrogenase electron transfer subunit [Oceanobacillus piezotolerans]RLL45522.1 dihydroorotate dehydrogenase electron transfer subunit [Oceanobacillus piezotolerans]